jgi:ArsR family transcriptional regulator, arsenate/arsenite/antimonite-responsive transcriptional repressor
VTPSEQQLRAFGDTTRLRLLVLLREQEMCVCDLGAVLKSPQPTISRHLSHLRKAGLVRIEKRGFWTFYSLSPARGAVHKRLLKILDDCLKEEKSFQKDRSTARRLLQKGNCC